MLMVLPAMQAALDRRARKLARQAARRRLQFVGRDAMVRAMAALIRADWREGVTPTLLNHEGALVVILRAVLCLRGVPWPAADAGAREAVCAALDAAGAKRPSLAQGQPEWTDGGVIRDTRVSCANCERPLPEGHKVYCSGTCGDAARHRRAWHDLNDARRLELNLIRKGRHHAARA